MKSFQCYLTGLCGMLIGMCTNVCSANDQATLQTFSQDVFPLLKSHCVDCHSGDKPEANINLNRQWTTQSILENQHLWFRVMDQLEFQQMPPKEEKQLSSSQRHSIVKWIKGDLTQSLSQKQQREGRSKFRRLTREEYANTFQDLFGFRPDVDLLPDDSQVDGYTKVSAALPLSMEGSYGYYQVAQELLSDWVLKRLPNPNNPRDANTQRAIAMESGQSPGHSLVLDDGWIVSFNTDDSSGRLKYNGVKTPGIHQIRMHVYAYQSEKPLLFGLYAGKTHSYPQEIELVDILEAPAGKPTIVETELYLPQRSGLRLIPFGIGVQVPKNHQAKNCKGPGLAVQWLEDQNPAQPMLVDRWLTADFPEDFTDAMRKSRMYLRAKGPYSYNKISPEEFVEFIRKTLTRIGPRLFRRDLTTQEIESSLAIVRRDLQAEKQPKEIFFERVVDLITSPEFFCVVESPGKLSDFALASRLSYFLWNSTPDEELLELARQGKLSDPVVLTAQTNRLLDDPKSARFINDFLDQWLDLHAINDTSPDNKLYPEYDDVLKFSSIQQTRATVEKILSENRSVREFVAPKTSLVNHRLAQHYGLNDVGGAKLQEVKFPNDSPYGGLWTQPAILKVTADGSSTSPVKRGVWLAERLLGTEISPPPPNIEPINPDTRGATTLRQQLALHSDSGTCAACHKKFDPYGFALESFDVMGQYRSNYRVLDEETLKLPWQQRKGKQLWKEGLPVDASGITPQGHAFKDIVELRNYLKQHPEQIAWGVTTHLLTYATATPTGPLDHSTVEEIVSNSAKADYSLRAIVHEIVQSKIFQWK